MRKKENPVLDMMDVYHEIYRRTGNPVEMSRSVIDAFAEIVEEAIEAGLEVKFGRLGYFSWETRKPRKDVIAGAGLFNSERAYYDIPGCRIPRFRAFQKWKKELKAATLDFTGIEKMGKYKELEEEQKGED